METVEIKWVATKEGEKTEDVVNKWKEKFPNKLISGKHFDPETTEIHISNEAIPQKSNSEVLFF